MEAETNTSCESTTYTTTLAHLSSVLFDHRWFFLNTLQHPHKATLKTLPQQNEFKLKTSY